MTSLPEDPLALIREDDRDRAVGRLQDAYAEGHLSHEEMDVRLGQVLTATTHGHLTSALSSLPAEKAATRSTIAAASGRIKRRGVWRVPRFLTVHSAMGRVHLDLSRAVVEHSEVDIELQLGTGRAKITVPRDATVDVEGLATGWKDTRYRPGRRAGTGGPTIRITGTMGFGRLKIRHAWR
ncbi:DUF1707 domain-containing protein [Streptomyces sp. NBC_01498]|uniref:DUF1707 SHOCT-like domain-containing protein n=1 Tax=Streptomyces sp. NBC_01498 TaxID=2975870 RepID=UPI002E7B6B11|nr:DUF1707 domain-containing protein [Streptomyces sp. NBC_01498]WTL25123.1 DUF1707 domain-containing protein [Streptomyces sp. NBC_01498]